MAIWLVRAGSHGEYEQKFIQENRVYVTWDDLDVDLAKLLQRGELTAEMTQRYPEAKPKTVLNWVSQVWPFAHEMQKGDLVVLPLKTQPAVYIGEITGDYRVEKAGPTPSSIGDPSSGSARPSRARTLAKTCCSPLVRSLRSAASSVTTQSSESPPCVPMGGRQKRWQHLPKRPRQRQLMWRRQTPTWMNWHEIRSPRWWPHVSRGTA